MLATLPCGLEGREGQVFSSLLPPTRSLCFGYRASQKERILQGEPGSLHWGAPAFLLFESEAWRVASLIDTRWPIESPLRSRRGLLTQLVGSTSPNGGNPADDDDYSGNTFSVSAGVLWVMGLRPVAF